MTVTITDFLLARVAEDESRATTLLAHTQYGYDINFYAERVLAECAAKRQILEGHLELASTDDRGARALSIATGGVLKVLAAIYKDHPDYQQEWAV